MTNNNKKTLEEPKLTVVRFDKTDVIATSEEHYFHENAKKTTLNFNDDIFSELDNIN